MNKYLLFSGVPRSDDIYHLNNGRISIEIGSEIVYANLNRESIPGIISVALKNEAKRILRESENTLREEKNLPKVGEGWISETELFYKLLEIFPSEKIVHHGRPSWLSPQHLDIYFPIKNIGIEYQGSQHHNPVEYFGGKKAFKKLQKLDGRKKLLCEQYNCMLIYVHEEYILEDVILKIKDVIAEYKNR